MARQQLAWRAMLYRLKAKFDIAPIAEEEVLRHRLGPQRLRAPPAGGQTSHSARP